ncbi:MAG: hypothetical protein VW258_07020 [Thalassolituus sp.]
MKKLTAFATVAMTLSATQAFAHHPAADIVDEEIYAQIDAMVADTPHATLEFDDMGSSAMTETTITTDTVYDLEQLIEDEDLLDYVQNLDGEVTVGIEFNEDGSVSMTINQLDW